jgi:hypothetical protein
MSRGGDWFPPHFGGLLTLCLEITEIISLAEEIAISRSQRLEIRVSAFRSKEGGGAAPGPHRGYHMVPPSPQTTAEPTQMEKWKKRPERLNLARGGI